MKELAKLLLKHAYIDFEGDISVDQVKQYLRNDDSKEAKALLTRVIEEKGIDDMLVTVADCLKEHLSTGISEEVLQEQLAVYTDS